MPPARDNLAAYREGLFSVLEIAREGYQYRYDSACISRILREDNEILSRRRGKRSSQQNTVRVFAYRRRPKQSNLTLEQILPSYSSVG
jgi:hypothetical protein